MKTIKLTIFSILGATLLGLGLYSCSNDDTTGVNELEKTNISKNVNRKVTDNIQLHELKIPLADGKLPEKSNFKVLVDLEEETIISYEFDNSIAESLGVKPELFLEYFEEAMGEGALTSLNATPKTETISHSECITKCHANFTNEDGTKKPGRGDCKFGCWKDSTIEILDKVMELIEKLS